MASSSSLKELPSILKFANQKGTFERQASQFRSKISRDGPHPPESGRYVLYVSYACPWAHRTLIVRNLKGLQRHIRISVVSYLMGEKGWQFNTPQEMHGCIPDPLYNSAYLQDLYHRALPDYKGRYTVPVLWDQKAETIVNNESAEIIRMLNADFNDLDGVRRDVDLYPEPLHKAIGEINTWVYDGLNNGVYKAGFATAQEAYEENALLVYKSLQRVESILAGQQYLVGSTLTEADIRLFTTIIRFDPVYFGHFKCNLLAIRDCPHTLNWLRRIYQMPAVKETVNMEHIKRHYYMSHKNLNPTGIVPLGNGPDLEAAIAE